MKAEDIRNMSETDILAENPMLIRAKRRAIARMNTVLNERKNNK
jgi:ribosomal protein L29